MPPPIDTTSNDAINNSVGLFLEIAVPVHQCGGDAGSSFRISCGASEQGLDIGILGADR